MNKLYILTGPAGVGKSTISRKIAENKEKSALIEGDEIYHQVVGGYVQAWREGNHLEVFWNVCIKIIEEYLENGYDVIFNYILSKENLELLKSNFSKYNIKFVVLLVSEEEIVKRDMQRPEDCQMKERCIELLNRFKNKKFDNKNILYTDNLTIEETQHIIEIEDRFTIS